MNPSFSLDSKWREQVLKDLVRRYLSAIDSRHRNASNEIRYVSTTLSRICLQHMGFRVTTQEVIDTLQATGHYFFTRDGLCQPDGTPISHQPDFDLFGESVPTSGPRIDQLRDRIHTNVPHQMVRVLRLTTIPTPTGTADDKRQQINEMMERLKRWCVRWQSASESSDPINKTTE